MKGIRAILIGFSLAVFSMQSCTCFCSFRPDEKMEEILGQIVEDQMNNHRENEQNH